MIEKFGNRINRDLPSGICEFQSFTSANAGNWTNTYKWLGLETSPIRKDKFEYMVIYRGCQGVGLGFVKGQFSIIKTCKLYVYRFFNSSKEPISVIEGDIIQEIDSYLTGEISDDCINALYDRLSRFVDNIAEHTSLAMCWPAITNKSAQC